MQVFQRFWRSGDLYLGKPQGGDPADLPWYLSPCEGLPMNFFIFFGFFRTYVHGNHRLGILYHKICSVWAVAGVSTYRSWIWPSANPCMQKSSMPCTCKVSQTIHHTGTHMLGTYASFLAIPTLRWSVSWESLGWGPRRSTPITFSVRGFTNGIFYLLWFV
jgi:hypothetical protein